MSMPLLVLLIAFRRCDSQAEPSFFWKLYVEVNHQPIFSVFTVRSTFNFCLWETAFPSKLRFRLLSIAEVADVAFLVHFL